MHTARGSQARIQARCGAERADGARKDPDKIASGERILGAIGRILDPVRKLGGPANSWAGAVSAIAASRQMRHSNDAPCLQRAEKRSGAHG